jgi:biotin carboxylase
MLQVRQKLVCAAGIRTVRQVCGKKFSNADAFLRSEAYPVALKLTDTACSDGVKLCKTFEETKEHFDYLLTV